MFNNKLLINNNYYYYYIIKIYKNMHYLNFIYFLKIKLFKKKINFYILVYNYGS
uniref:Uncharacterized protein n=1 Tax=viral metagenome TaxID=1070528 RepID=A0A6C0H749_9ZZZZ